MDNKLVLFGWGRHTLEGTNIYYVKLHKNNECHVYNTDLEQIETPHFDMLY